MSRSKLYLFLFIPLVACQLEGVDTDNPNGDGIIENAVDSVDVEDEALMLTDSIDGEPNEMVLQAANGLRIEWDVKKDDKIQENDVVMVNYTARVAAGDIYDTNKELGDPVPLKTNIGMMIEGWELGLREMHIGDKGRIMIPASMAYGEDGYLTVVPPKADIIVDIEIVSRVKPINLEDGVKVYKWKTTVDGANPKVGQRITFDYFAYKKGKNAGIYDNSYQNENSFSFKFESDKVVAGLHIGMAVMKPGENAFIEIPAKAAYGSRGLLDLVPKNTDIVYDVRVQSIE